MVTAFNDSVTWFLGHGLHLDCPERSWYALSGQSRHFDTPSYFVPAGQSAKDQKKNIIDFISMMSVFFKVLEETLNC